MPIADAVRVDPKQRDEQPDEDRAESESQTEHKVKGEGGGRKQAVV